MIDRGHVGTSARWLGFAGLLPQIALTGALLLERFSGQGSIASPFALLALAYPLLILSFLGGTWWALATRTQANQARIMVYAVMPSLIAMAAVIASVLTFRLGGILVLTGVALVSTLAVDRWLVSLGITPKGWMHLRVPLSLGLGGLTILARILVRV